MDNETIERLQKQIINFAPVSKDELKKILKDYAKLMELVRLTKEGAITLEDEDKGQISLQSPEEVYKLKDLLS